MNFQSAVDRDADLASPSTLCRFENRVNQWVLREMSVVMVDVFIESFDRAPEELILDFNSTDAAVHGEQVGRFFHGYYDHYCFFAAACILRQSSVGCASPGQQRRGRKERLGNPATAGEKILPGLAACSGIPRRFMMRLRQGQG